MSVAYSIVFVTGVGVLASCLPPMMGWQYNSSSLFGLEQSLMSETFQMGTLTLILSTLPMIIDLILDWLFGLSSSKSQHYWTSRAVIALNVAISALVLRYESFDASRGGNGVSLISRNFLVNFSCAKIIYFGSILYSLCVADRSYFSAPKLTMIGVTFNLSVVLGLFASSGRADLQVLDKISQAFLYLTVAEVILLFLVWGIKVMKKSRSHWSSTDLSSMVFLAPTVLLPLGELAIYAAYGTLLHDGTTQNLSAIVGEVFIGVVLVTVIPGRIARLDALDLQRALLDSKKAYVRYYSHELRTPLNTMFLGLQMAINLTSKSKHRRDVEVRETLKDVNTACEAAVKILDELLFYDRLDSGNLTVKKDVVSPIEMVKRNMALFAAQARAKKIRLLFVNSARDRNSDRSMSSFFNRFRRPSALSSRSNGTSLGVPLESSDIIYVDQQKIDQVMCNLLSNALKFTPEDGAVKVTTRVIFDSADDPASEDRDSINVGVPQLQRILSTSIGAVKRSQSIVHPEHKDRKERKERKNRAKGSFSAKLDDEENPGDKEKQSDQKNSEISRGDDFVAKSSRKGSLAARVGSIKNILGTRDRRSNSFDDRFRRGKLIIEVTDTGKGISSDDQRLLFTEVSPFNPDRLEAGGGHGGHGLGLWICKGIMDMHGGKITMHSKGEGKGSTFIVELPVKRRIIKKPQDNSVSNELPPAARAKMASLLIEKLSKDDVSNRNSGRVAGPRAVLPNEDDDNDDDESNSESKDSYGEVGREVRIPDQEKSSRRRAATETLVQGSVALTRSHNSRSRDILLSAVGDVAGTPQSPGITRHPSYGLKSSHRTSLMASVAESSRRKASVSIRQSCVEAVQRTSKKANGLRLLVVDDSAMTRKMLVKTLQLEGHTCEEADDGASALKILQELLGVSDGGGDCGGSVKAGGEETRNPIATSANLSEIVMSSGANSSRILPGKEPFDAILMDYIMPIMEGPAATKAIRDLGYKCPIFGVTGNAVASDVEHFLKCGANKVLIKPLSMEAFNEAVKEYLGDGKKAAV